MILAGVLIIGIVIWWAAYQRGYSSADLRAQKELAVAGGSVRDPLKGSAVPLNPSLLPQPRDQQVNLAGSGQTRPPPAPRQPAGSGPLADTRQVGLNYCTAAGRLDKEAADRAAAFLVQNGIPAIAVVDRGSSGAKNAALYKVVCLQGITAREYSSREQVRTKLEAELTRLGQVYRKDPKGRVDFGQYAWEKLKD
jgi:hypothetical protein